MSACDLTQDELRRLFVYDPETGVLTRRVNHANGLKAGTVAGTMQRGRARYFVTRINRRLYLVHRLAWLYMHGEWPKGFIDHINGNGLDNRLYNLRDVTNKQNLQASLKPPKSNTSGFKGVYWNKKQSKWVAGISIEGRRKYIGSFDSPEVAHEAYLAKKAEVHFL